MGQVKAEDIIDRVAITLQDIAHVRWPRAELLGYLNEGQRQIVIHRPDANAVTVTFTCTHDSKQALPVEAARLLSVRRNVGGNAITKIAFETLDRAMPNWHEVDATEGVDHYAYDQVDPGNFFLFPRPAADHEIELVYAGIPADLANETDEIILNDIYVNVLQDYILYRAYAKDQTYGDPGRSALYLQAFNGAIGVKTQTDGALAARGQAQPGVVQ